jgi:hypothetical protein
MEVESRLVATRSWDHYRGKKRGREVEDWVLKLLDRV